MVIPRAAPYLALLALLLIGVIIALAVAGGQKRLPAPFGLAATGLVAFESEGDILVANADGSSRRPLIAIQGAQWSQVFSRRGDRIAYWSSPKSGDPASLFVADADGSNGRLMTGDQTFLVAGGLPAVSWSPDDRQLAFSSEAGDMYVVNADGTGLHRIGDPNAPASGPRLVARRHTDRLPWAAAGRSVLADVQLGDRARRDRRQAWSSQPKAGGRSPTSTPAGRLDGRSLLVHTGGRSETDPDTDISIAQRDAAGVWSHWAIVGGPTLDYHPSWSNAGAQFSFIRAVEGSNPRRRGLC